MKKFNNFFNLPFVEKIVSTILIIILASILYLILGWGISFIWNHTVCQLFGITTMTISQGVGLKLILDLFSMKINFTHDS